MSYMLLTYVFPQFYDYIKYIRINGGETVRF